MKNSFVKIMLLLLTAAIILPACGKQKPIFQSGFVPVTTVTTPDTSEIPGSKDTVMDTDNEPAPIVFEQQMEVGKLKYSIDKVQAVTNVNEAGAGGFDPYSAVAMHDGTYYQQAQDNWLEYGNLYETVYTYPQFITDNGELIDGAHMILLDITVENQNATNEYKANEKLEARYGNPYLFKLDSVLFLVDKSQLDTGAMGKQADFFSGYENRPEHPMAFELKPGETISLRIGFLTGDRADGTPTKLSDLVVSTNASSLDNMWFDLNLEDAE